MPERSPAHGQHERPVPFYEGGEGILVVGCGEGVE
jgi:hypothetical protein